MDPVTGLRKIDKLSNKLHPVRLEADPNMLVKDWVDDDAFAFKILY